MEGNEQQNRAIRWNTGPALVLAGPGSGKTFTTVERVRYLIRVHKVDPSNILVITFTRAAARQMRDRFFRRMEGESLPVCFGTFHAVFFQILKSSYHYPQNCILKEKEKREYLRTVLAGLSEEDREGIARGEDWEEGLLAEFGYVKNCGQMSEDFRSAYLEPASFRKTFLAFQRLLQEMRKLDLDDFAAAVKHLFTNCPEALQRWRERFSYILVDEFQDINAAQYEVVKLLAGEQKNLFVVGDDDQAIYGFRGSDPAIMRRFVQDYPQAVQISLSVNYRSLPGIVKTAGRLIGENKNRFPKHIEAGRTTGQKQEGDFWGWEGFTEDNTVLLRAFADRRQQARAIAAELAKIRRANMSAKASEKAGQPVTTAAIFRTNSDALLLSEELKKAGIPFTMREKLKSPYAHPVCRDLLAYLEFAKGQRSRELFFRIMNRPCRYLSRRSCSRERISLEELAFFYRREAYMEPILTKLRKDIGYLAGMDLYAGVNYIRRGIGYEEWMKKEMEEKAYREGKEMADFFQESMRQFHTVEEVKEHIESYERSLQKAIAGNEEDKENPVALITMHGSKGLEYDVVFLPDCNEGIVPHKKSAKGEQIEEERRMFYVGMTRARERLYISWVGGTKEEPGFVSRFLGDMGYREPYRN